MDKIIQFEDLPLSELKKVCLSEFNDNRGVFTKLFCGDAFSQILQNQTIKQVNISHSYLKGTIRGMHFQYPPYTETKIIKCLKGEVYDVVIDIRMHSKTFLEWYGVHLTESDKKMLLIPPGFAHGFQTLSNNAELLYMHTEKYVKNHEGGVNFNDPKISINWKLPPKNVSERDMNFEFISNNFKGI